MLYQIFIDFDGTITVNDVGYEMFKKFTHGATETLVQSYRRGKMSSLECLSGECDLWNVSAPKPEEVWRFLDSQSIRPGLDRFLKWLNEENIKPLILSEGFDFYIERILKSNGLADLNRITNSVRFKNNKLFPEFPYHGLGCGECSNCKGYHISRLRSPGDCAVYIGDGHSDFHASQAADIVFARSHLEELLSSIKRDFFAYTDFNAIAVRLKDLMRSGLFTTSERINFYTFSERHRKNVRNLRETGEAVRLPGYFQGLRGNKSEFNLFREKIIIEKKAIHLAMEDKSGTFLGEALIAASGEEGCCHADLRLLPEFVNNDLAIEAWKILLDRTTSHWPSASIIVTPNAKNQSALDLFQKLGFEFDGEEEAWQPSTDNAGAKPVRYRKMIKKDIASNRRL